MHKFRTLALVAILVSGVFITIPAQAEGEQFARPSSDVSPGGWTTTPLWQRVDEASPDDNDWIRADYPGAVTELGLSPVTDPDTASGHVLRVRHKSGSDGTGRLNVQLKQGAAVLASFTTTASADFVTHSFTLAEAEADSITDYSTLSVRLANTNGKHTPTSWIELEVPAADDPPPPPDPECDDGADNDGDDLTDWPADPGCTDANDDDETDPQQGGSISGDVTVASLHVPPGETFSFDPNADTTLHVTDGSVLNEGTLEMKPASSSVEHRLIFEDVDEADFAGGGMGPTSPTDPILQTDPGLWVMGAGCLDVQGTPKTSWTRSPETAEGWLPGDELRTTPVGPNDFTNFPTYTPGDPVPEITDAFGTVRKAEVMNLTRNVFIGGEAPDENGKHRSHIFIRSTCAQTIKHAEMRHLGPRKLQGNPPKDRKILGRWALHFHHNQEGSIGSVVEGNVVRDVGGHGFVPHASDGIDLTRNVAFDIIEIAYWWDPPSPPVAPPVGDPDTASEDVDYVGNLGARVLNGDSGDVSGMFFAEVAGSESSMIGNVMVGVIGVTSKDPTGFGWGSNQGHAGWDVQDNLAHNNNVYGGWLYGNPSDPNPLHGFTAYNNGKSGWFHGSYDNPYKYFDLTTSGADIGLEVQAVSRNDSQGEPMRFLDCRLHGTDEAVRIRGHVKDSNVNPAQFLRCDLRSEGVIVRIKENDFCGCHIGRYDFIDTTVDGNRDLEPSDFIAEYLASGSTFRLQQPDCDAWRLVGDGFPEWESIAPFADTPTCL